jgi:hypothetical protein
MVNLRSRQAAFTLIDALAALMLFSAGVLAAVMFHFAEVREIRHMHERTVGLLAAESELERLAALPFERLAVGADRPLDLDLPSVHTLMRPRGTLTVTKVAPGLREATVHIVWDTPRRFTREVALTRRFAGEAAP